MSLFSQLIREPKFTVVWLEFANAYGRIPHQLIDTALKHYHEPNHIKDIFLDYLQDIQLSFQVKDRATA